MIGDSSNAQLDDESDNDDENAAGRKQLVSSKVWILIVLASLCGFLFGATLQVLHSSSLFTLGHFSYRNYKIIGPLDPDTTVCVGITFEPGFEAGIGWESQYDTDHPPLSFNMAPDACILAPVKLFQFFNSTNGEVIYYGWSG